MIIIRLFFILVFLLFGADLVSADVNARSWFHEHQKDLFLMKHLLDKYPKIDRVDPALRIDFVRNGRDFDKEELEAYKGLAKKCLGLGIEHVAVFRETLEEEVISSVNFTIDSEGLLTKGSSVSIEYLADISFIEKARQYGLSYESLGVSGWFIVRRLQK